MTTVWPRCRSGADGSKPTFTVRAAFSLNARCSLPRSSSPRMMSTAPLRRYSSCSCGGRKDVPVLEALFGIARPRRPAIGPTAAKSITIRPVRGSAFGAQRRPRVSRDGRRGTGSEEPALLQADEASPADDDVVVQADSHQIACARHGTGELDVIAA